MRHTALPAALICAATACSGEPTMEEPASAAAPIPIAAAQARPDPIDQTFTEDFCAFPILVHLTGKGKTIDLGGGRLILTAPGLKATITNLDNQNQQTFGITGAVHQSTLANGNVEQVFTGRNALFDPIISGLFLVVGRFSVLFDEQGDIVQPLHGTGRLVDICELLT